MLIVLISITVLCLVCLYYFNRIIILSNRIENAWSQIDVQLKKRIDLVPNLIDTVKGYMKHEKDIIKEITKSRERMIGAKTDEERLKADKSISAALKNIFALAENYPDLKANENFLMLQEELASVENKIAYARQFYNDSILAYNNMVSTFPGVIFAKILGKEKRKHIEIEEKERKTVKVEF